MSSSNNNGFSLLELLIAMVITMALMTAASTLLANALRVRSRENQKSDALADTQRALNVMSREIANAGFNLTGNGIVAADSGQSSIRIRSNLDRYEVDDPSTSALSRDSIMTESEDIKYFINEAEETMYLVRHDPYGNRPAPGDFQRGRAGRAGAARPFALHPIGKPAVSACQPAHRSRGYRC